MSALRLLFVAAFFGCFVVIAANARWEGRLTRADHTWIVDLGRSPIWAPPLEPTHAKFKEDFTGSAGFPREGAPGTNIQRLMKADWMAVDLLLYLWAVTVVGGLLYLALRGPRRDLILHIGLSIGIGLTVAAVLCVGVWLLLGGWGPPVPEVFGGVGLLFGIVTGVTSFTPGVAA